MPASVTNTFIADTPILAAEVNQNFNDIIVWLNGANITQGNLAPFVSSITWNLSGADQAIIVNSTSTVGHFNLIQSGALNAGGYVIKITDTHAQAAGAAEMFLNATSATNSMPGYRYDSVSGATGDAIQVNNNGAKVFGVDKTGNVTAASFSTNGIIALPPGLIFPFGGTVAPAGYHLCDGSSQLRVDPVYAALYAVIGTAYGKADGTHFNLPDFRGKFMRGVDHGQAYDPDAASRTALPPGSATGDSVGSFQNDHTRLPRVTPFHTQGTTDAAGSHSHDVIGDGNQGNNGVGSGTFVYLNLGGTQTHYSGYTASAGSHSHTYGSDITGGDSETRPINVYVEYIVKL